MDKYLVSEDTKRTTLSDEASLIKAACTEPTAFTQLYQAYIRPIYRYIYSKVGEAKLTEDLTSQVFLAALEGLPGYHHQGYFAAWLFSIARRKVADYYRSRRLDLSIEISQEDPSEKDDPITVLIQAEETMRISQLIHQLDERDQELLRLRLVADLGFSDIARLINSNMEASKKRFYRLLAQLRQQLEHDYD